MLVCIHLHLPSSHMLICNALSHGSERVVLSIRSSCFSLLVSLLAAIPLKLQTANCLLRGMLALVKNLPRNSTTDFSRVFWRRDPLTKVYPRQSRRLTSYRHLSSDLVSRRDAIGNPPSSSNMDTYEKLKRATEQRIEYVENRSELQLGGR